MFLSNITNNIGNGGYSSLNEIGEGNPGILILKYNSDFTSISPLIISGSSDNYDTIDNIIIFKYDDITSMDNKTNYMLEVMNKYLLIDVLIIGGGGAGGNNNGGGGGAGGFQFFENIKLNYQKSYNIIVGNGGIALDKNNYNNKNGSMSSFDNLISYGGGSGGSFDGNTYSSCERKQSRFL